VREDTEAQELIKFEIDNKIDMNIIVPMAGMGKRMRPHTLTVPKPLVPIAGKPIVQRLVEDIAKVAQNNIDHVAFVIGHFGDAVEKQLLEIALSVGATGSIHYQEEALGTAHAILCAKEHLVGNTIVAFADTLFKADFTLDKNEDGIIWVQKIEDPRAFGVVKLNQEGVITDFVEKPQEFVSDLAIIGIYYFRDGVYLRDQLQYLIDNDVRDKGEYQITNALENMKMGGIKFKPGAVTEWLDCGNKNATVHTNSRYLEYIKESPLIADSALITNSVIIPPVYVGENVKINNSVIGPHVSVGDYTQIMDSRIENSIIQTHSEISKAVLGNSMIGNYAILHKKAGELSVGDYNQITD
jgi:glucose-1-phosphate thymidylyltransferase